MLLSALQDESCSSSTHRIVVDFYQSFSETNNHKIIRNLRIIKCTSSITREVWIWSTSMCNVTQTCS